MLELAAFFASLLLAPAPAQAAPCTTHEGTGSPIAFPTNKPEDVPFARSMAPIILPHVLDRLPHSLTCLRSKVSTAHGDYVIGGENGEPYPRMAFPADGRKGPIAYLAASRARPDKFALVVHGQGQSLTIVKRFYSGIPADAQLAEDIRKALADEDGIMAYLPDRKMVMYGFDPGGDGIPPPVQSGSANGISVTAGPQILVLDSGDRRFLDMPGDMKHTPSGFACQQSFDGLPILLKTIDPRKDYLSCGYRVGTDLAYRKEDPVRYQITLINPARRKETPRSVFDELIASARETVRLKGDHPPPLATGTRPAPEMVAYWDTEDGEVQGFWLGTAGDWIFWLQVKYPPSPANDAEAAKVAQILFAQAARQVK